MAKGRNIERVYGLGGFVDVFPEPIVADKAPTTGTDTGELGQVWIDKTNNDAYFLVNKQSKTWINAGGGAGVFASLTVSGATTLNGSVSMAPTTITDTISIGNAAQTGTLTLGESTAGQDINIGSGVNAAAQVISIGNGASAADSTVNILSGVGTAGAGVLNLANNTRVTTVDIGDVAPAAARTFNIAGGDQSQNDTFNLMTGNPSANAQAINIFTGTPTGGTQTITMGNATAGFETSIAIASPDISVAPSTDTQASPTAASTVNHNVGAITFTGFTTAAAGAQVFTITNDAVSATSAILVSASNGGANDAQMTVTRVNPGAGSFTVTLTNNGAAALNGDIIITFWVLS